MLSVYPACFFKEDSGYSVVLPDLNWLSTCGDSLNEAMTMAVECLAGYLYLEQKEGADVPTPSDISSISLDAVAAELEVSREDAFINLISVDVAAYGKEHFEKSVKKTLSIPKWLNTAALKQDINFSKVLQEALIAKIRVR